MRANAEKIAEMKKRLPDWELTKQTLADVKLRYPLK